VQPRPDRAAERAVRPHLHRDDGLLLLVGKWHVAPRPEVVGFDRAFYPLVCHRNRMQVYFDHQRRAELVDGFGPDEEIRRSCEFIRRGGDRPWFLFHNLSLPHMPYYDVPEEHLGRYDTRELTLRPNVTVGGKLYHDPEVFKVYLFDHLCTKLGLAPYLRTPEGYDIRRLYAQYCGLVSCVDEQVGRR
jgi:arylsulfatase A-like enzyme